MHFYFVIRLLKSLPQSLSREQGFNKNISWALRMSFLCCSLLGRWGENGNYCHGSGPGNERTYMSREIKYKLEGGGVLCTFNSSHPPTSLSPWGQTGKKSVRLPSHTPLLASFLLLRAICVQAASDRVTPFIPLENIYSKTLEIALGSSPINFLLTPTFSYLETQDESIPN